MDQPDSTDRYRDVNTDPRTLRPRSANKAAALLLIAGLLLAAAVIVISAL